jgi:WD40 repeat protein
VAFAKQSADGTVNIVKFANAVTGAAGNVFVSSQPVKALAFSAKGGSLSVVGANSIVVLDVAKQKVVSTLVGPAGADFTPTAVAFSPDAKLLTAGTSQGNVYTWAGGASADPLTPDPGRTILAKAFTAAPAKPVLKVFYQGTVLLTLAGNGLATWDTTKAPYPEIANFPLTKASGNLYVDAAMTPDGKSFGLITLGKLPFSDDDFFTLNISGWAGGKLGQKVTSNISSQTGPQSVSFFSTKALLTTDESGVVASHITPGSNVQQDSTQAFPAAPWAPWNYMSSVVAYAEVGGRPFLAVPLQSAVGQKAVRGQVLVYTVSEAGQLALQRAVK